MTTKNILSLVVVAVILTAMFLFWDSFINFSYELNELKKTADQTLLKDINQIKEEIKREILAPPPLRAEKEFAQSFLTQNGVLKWTNNHRTSIGLKPLAIDQQLSHAAALKINNMFQGQYFDHISPEGNGPDYWIKSAGYEYIMIGENLALGNFENDEALVQAWIDSPGHRANIMNERYTEIGIAVSQGIFEGRRAWLAVQTFGLPLSACPSPDKNLKIQLESLTVQLETLKARIDQLKQKIEASDKRDPEYNNMVDEYNMLVGQYNNIIAEFKVLVGQYNNQIADFNTCVSK